ncbi:MAG: maleylpyruvate isomerase family mycothiol-dependent enzyme [Nocardioidaceae bacterium]|nr:maleylpyruvate isomerase family mycothiol-dependent enzyme [Nocardioidaceae bacterium]MCL2612025.1 maleylpyruvate isomerase family mycothiol-dependent enzyme [Nocardioidaceae bacterium]
MTFVPQGSSWSRPLVRAIEDFAGILTTGDLTAPVPSCPGWTLADLGNHLRGVHLWAAHAVAEGNPQGTSEPVTTEQLADAYLDAGRHLLDVMEAAGADLPCWTFGADRTVAFWWRRQTHEVTLHLYDALLSQGRQAAWSIDPRLAWDGVDEVATMFYPRQVRAGRVQPLAGTLRLRSTDADGSAPVVTIGAAEPVVELTGTAAELLLTLWKRRPAADPAAAALLGSAITP